MEISFTRFRVYRECPWKYKLMFVEGKKIPLDPPSALGISLHKTLEAFHQGGGGGVDELLDCYGRNWLSGGFPSEDLRRTWREKGMRILEKYMEAERARRTETVGVEREFVYPLGRHTVRGMVDRIDLHPDGRHEIIEYKTQLDVQRETPVEQNLQLRFYALGARESLGIDPEILTVHYLASGHRLSVAYDPKGEADLKTLILETADWIEGEGFSPNVSFCAHCGFRNTCPLSVAKD